MTYEDLVIEAARKGLAEGFTVMTPEMEKLLRVVYQAGYDRAKLDAFRSERGKWD